MTGDDSQPQSRRPMAVDIFGRPKPKRFYETVTFDSDRHGHRILLDGRPVRTPAKNLLVLPENPLAAAVSAEWDAQGDQIEPDSMPLTRLANTTIDRVVPRLEDVVAEIVDYGASDLLCYRAAEPERLIVRQAETWDPILDWAASDLDVNLAVTQGLVHHDQPEAVFDALRAAAGAFGGFALTGVHNMTTLTGSAILALAVSRGRLTPEEAWRAAHIDEDWQIEQWGKDGEAEERRNRRWTEMAASARFCDLCRN